MKSIFIVLGVTGENDQQRSWLVKAFPSESEALAFIDKLESTYQSFADEEAFDKDSEDHLVDAMRALDENFEFDPETGTEYSVTECPFESSARPISRPNGDSRRFRDQSSSRGTQRQGRRPPRR